MEGHVIPKAIDFINAATENGFTYEQAEFMWDYLKVQIGSIEARLCEIEQEPTS